MSSTEKKAEQELKSFVAKSPSSKYIFDSERDAPKSDICRESNMNEKDCRMIHLHSTKMFAVMQELGFFCALPSDPSRTHMECTPIPKS